jgi:hypothetical protein
MSYEKMKNRELLEIYQMRVRRNELHVTRTCQISEDDIEENAARMSEIHEELIKRMAENPLQ